MQSVSVTVEQFVSCAPEAVLLRETTLLNVRLDLPDAKIPSPEEPYTTKLFKVTLLALIVIDPWIFADVSTPVIVRIRSMMTFSVNVLFAKRLRMSLAPEALIAA